MSSAPIAATLSIFHTRLKALQGFIAKAESHATDSGKSLDELVSARIAPDMLPFTHQVVFSCMQARQFVAWLKGDDTLAATPDPVPANWNEVKDYLTATVALLAAAQAENLSAPAPDKRVELGGMAMHLLLPVQRYIDDWLMPNFYFHLTTAYALLRAAGVPLGKADFMTYVAGDLRPNGEPDHSLVVTGGCQCGRIRYSARIECYDAYLCHCRKCQRATGGFAAAFVELPAIAVRWQSEPDWYASSPVARRPFCSVCGTPLGFAWADETGSVDLTVGSFDDPSRFRPIAHAGAESLIEAWLDTRDLPRHYSASTASVVKHWRAAGLKVPE